MYKACIMATRTTQAYLIDSLTHLERNLSTKASNKCPSVCNMPKIAQLKPKRYQISLSRYNHTTGNFRGRKLSQISRFCDFTGFLREICACTLLWYEWTIRISFSAKNFHQFVKVFIRKSFLLYGMWEKCRYHHILSTVGSGSILTIHTYKNLLGHTNMLKHTLTSTPTQQLVQQWTVETLHSWSSFCLWVGTLWCF